MISQPLQHLDSLLLSDSATGSELPAEAETSATGRLAGRFLAQLGPDARLPCLNELSRSSLRRETLVKFRGMVQATLEPELYHKASGHFRDRPLEADIAATGSNDDDDEAKTAGWASILGERQRCLCVPVPHETAWLRADLAARDRIDEAELASLYAGLSVSDDPKEGSSEAKKANIDGTGGDAGGNCDNNDDSCAMWDGDAVELLIYADECDLRVHDLVETVAVISIGEGPLRLHALSHKRLACQVPTAAMMAEAAQSPPTEVDADTDADNPQWAFLRTALLGVFADLLLGDALAAEYLLLHLMSAVYLRGDVANVTGDGIASEGLVVGKLALNLACCRAQVARHLGRLLDLLMPRLCQAPLSLRFLNTGRLTPRLDCDTCRLRPGLLQMPARTQLLLDETALEAGRLDETGLANLRAVSQLVRDQTVQFDLHMYKKDFPTDLRVLIVSEGKSVLPCDVLLPLEPSHFVSEASAEADFVRLMDKVTPDAPFLREARRYLASVGGLAASAAAYTVDAAAQQWIEEDFIRRRQAARAAAANADAAAADAAIGVTAEDLSLRLVLCRLLALSLGRSRPSRTVWDIVGRMEDERKRRVLRASKNA